MLENTTTNLWTKIYRCCEETGLLHRHGGYYYYNPLKGKDYSQTLTAVHEHALSIGIPLCYYNLDSWWYQKSVQKWKRTLLGGFGRIIGGGLYGGTLLWEPDPQALDISPKELGENLNVVFTAHNRWVANNHRMFRNIVLLLMETKPCRWKKVIGMNHGLCQRKSY